MDAHRNLRPRHLEIAQQIAHDHVLPQIAADHGHVIGARIRGLFAASFGDVPRPGGAPPTRRWGTSRLVLANSTCEASAPDANGVENSGTGELDL